MIAVTVNGQNCWLLQWSPNAAKKVRLGVTLPVDAQRSLTGRSSRRPQSPQVRYSLEYTVDMLSADFHALRAASLTSQDEPILAPIWPHAIRVGLDTATITAGLVVAWTQDWASWAINPGSLAGYDFAAPLLFGRLTSPPAMSAVNDDMVTADLSLEEDAPAAYSFAPAAGVLPADTTFNTAGGWAAPVFPFVPEPSMSKPGIAVVDVERSAIGPGRQKSTTFYPQTPEQLQEAAFILPAALDAAKLIAWWARRAAGTDPHWVAQTQKLGMLSADVAATATALAFVDPLPALGGLGQVALFDPMGNMELARIAGSSTSGLALTAGLAQSWLASWTTVAPAMLARHTSKELSLEYSPAETGWMAVAKLAWREVAPEYAPPAGETRGTTLGRLTGTAWFFQIDLDYAGAIQSSYLTNWESGGIIGGHTWTYAASDFDKLISSFDLGDDNCNFSLRWFAGCPWENWMPGQLAARGFLTISKADFDSSGNLSNFRAVWKGELARPQLDGTSLKATVLGANALFARCAPKQVMSTLCGTNLFRPRCGLLLSDWIFNATIVSVAGNVVTVGTISRANGAGLPGGFGATDWFALGWLGWSSSGLPYRNGVLTSAALSAGQIVLTLERASTLTGGAVITIVPGCDRLFGTCGGKFGNSGNNRGFPFMPAISPSFIIPQKNATSAKK